MTSDSSGTEAFSHSEATPAAGSSPSMLHTIFLGPNGMRAGWRLLIFLCIVFVLGRGMGFLLHHIPAIVAWQNAQPKGALTAYGMIFGEGLSAFILLVSAWIMTKIERRSFADYGLPWGEALGKRFWQGVPLGFATLTLLLAAIAALHGFSLDGVAIGGAEAVKYGILFGIGFILVGFFEEFSFRGYLQATLGSGVGFWPAAILLSILFGAVHLGNTGEAKIGAFMAGCFGLLAAFALKRTGNLWLPIGMHASWDWGETYFYGTPDSGQLAQGHFLNSSFHGPDWLTGGTVGPEGSIFVFFVLIAWAIIIHFLFPAKQGTA